MERKIKKRKIKKIFKVYFPIRHNKYYGEIIELGYYTSLKKAKERLFNAFKDILKTIDNSQVDFEHKISKNQKNIVMRIGSKTFSLKIQEIEINKNFEKSIFI